MVVLWHVSQPFYIGFQVNGETEAERERALTIQFPSV
jgi:hypothetical protein